MKQENLENMKISWKASWEIEASTECKVSLFQQANTANVLQSEILTQLFPQD